MEHAEQLQLLGEATARGHQFELVTAQVLGRVLEIEQSSARLVAATMGTGSTLGVLQELVARKVCGPLQEPALRAWLNEARAANEARNRVIHSPWVRGDGRREVDSLSVVARRSFKLEPRSREDLRADIEALAKAVAGASELLRV